MMFRSNNFNNNQKMMPIKIENEEVKKLVFKVTINETKHNGKIQKKIVGYSDDIEVINKTMKYCIQKKDNDNFCSLPIVTGSSSATLWKDLVFVDDYEKRLYYTNMI